MSAWGAALAFVGIAAASLPWLIYMVVLVIKTNRKEGW